MAQILTKWSVIANCCRNFPLLGLYDSYDDFSAFLSFLSDGEIL